MTVVYELPPERRQLAWPAFSEARFDRAQIDSVFEGRQPGRVFVDDPEHPTAAILARTFGYYAGGDPGNLALRRFIRDAPPEPGIFQDLYGYVPATNTWKQVLLEDHHGLLEDIPRHDFKWYPTEQARAVVEGWRERLPAGATMAQIDLDLARRVDQEMNQFIKPFWLSHEAFAEGGFGYCLMLGDEIASVAYTVSVSSTEANIDVETVERYRRRGFSSLTSSAFIEHCRQLDVTPTWDSDGNNLPSRALAARLGFQEGPLSAQLSPPRGTSILGPQGIWTQEENNLWRRTV